MNSKFVRRYLLAGLAVWLPIIVTLLVLRFIVDLLDKTISLLPAAYQPEQLVGMSLPGLGVLLSLMVLLITGIIASNIIGQRFVGWGEALLLRIPLVRSIYNASKQVFSTLFASDSQAFRKVVLVEYPRKGLWSIAFHTGKAMTEANHHTEEEMISIFIPTTPNPTSGFLMMVPRQQCIELDMTVDEALKYIISLGVVQVESPKHSKSSH